VKTRLRQAPIDNPISLGRTATGRQMGILIEAWPSTTRAPGCPASLSLHQRSVPAASSATREARQPRSSPWLAERTARCGENHPQARSLPCPSYGLELLASARPPSGPVGPRPTRLSSCSGNCHRQPWTSIGVDAGPCFTDGLGWLWPVASRSHPRLVINPRVVRCIRCIATPSERPIRAPLILPCSAYRISPTSYGLVHILKPPAVGF